MDIAARHPGRSNHAGWNAVPLLTCVVAITALLSGCRSKPPVAEVPTGPPVLEPNVPAGYTKIAPAAADGSTAMLAQTAAIFRATLKEVRFTYNDCSGPRTNYVFSDASSIAGETVPAETTLKVFGGPTPRGTWASASELPQLALDSQYVTFLRNTDWTFSPVVGNLVFRVEMLAGRELLVDPSGRAVVGWDADGPMLSERSVSATVGSQRHGYRTADAPAPSDHPNSGVPDPRGETRPADTPPVNQGRPADAPMTRAPSPAEIRKAGLFARPALSADAVANEQVASVQSFVAAASAAAERAQIKIGGRLTLDPNWRCWSSTPTANATP